MDQKRSPDDSTPLKSKAARFNLHTLKKLRAAIDNDPETDLLTQMPMDYSSRLMDMQDTTKESLSELSLGEISIYFANISPVTEKMAAERREEDIRESLSASDSVDILFPLSEAVIRQLEEISTTAETLPNGLSQRLFEVMQVSEILWTSAFPRHKMVFKCATDIVVKAVRKMDDYTEYTTLQYLQQHKPSIPAPKPLGLVRMSGILLIFMTHMPSMTLGEVWHRLDCGQKASVREQLNTIISDLRSIPYSDGLPLGGVAGEGCKDVRRHLRRSGKPIKTLGEFEDFLFSSPHPGGQVFVELLRQLSPLSHLLSSPSIVFTHGDLRPDNIVVEMVDSNRCVVSGLLDWEYGGFYPEYYEAIRCTNCLAPYEDNDWYLYLPDCISPKRYTHWWLLDRVREARLR